MKFEYRVVWKRLGSKRKVKKFSKLRPAEKRLSLLVSLNKSPWVIFGQDPDDFKCCGGYQCNCGGLTVRQYHEAYNAELPPIEYAMLEKRQVGDWGEL